MLGALRDLGGSFWLRLQRSEVELGDPLIQMSVFGLANATLLNHFVLKRVAMERLLLFAAAIVTLATTR